MINIRHSRLKALVLCFAIMINAVGTFSAYAGDEKSASEAQAYTFSSDTSVSVTKASDGSFYTDSHVKVYGTNLVRTVTYENDKTTTYGEKRSLSGKRTGRYITLPRAEKVIIAFGEKLSGYNGNVKISFELGCHQAWQNGTIEYSTRDDSGAVTIASEGLKPDKSMWRSYEIYGVDASTTNLDTLAGNSKFSGKSGVVINYPGNNDGTDFFYIRNFTVERTDYKKRDSSGRLEYSIPIGNNHALGDWFYDESGERLALRRGGAIPVRLGEKYSSGENPVTVDFDFSLSVSWQNGRIYYVETQPDGSTAKQEKLVGSISAGATKHYTFENVATNAGNLSYVEDGDYTEKGGVVVYYKGNDSGELFYLSNIQITPQNGIIGGENGKTPYKIAGIEYKNEERGPVSGDTITGVKLYRTENSENGLKTVILAVYDSEGNLIDISLSGNIPDITLGAAATVPFDLQLPQTDGFSVKAFVFDTAQSLKPLADMSGANANENNKPYVFVIGDDCVAAKSDYEKIVQQKYGWGEKLDFGTVVQNYAENGAADYVNSGAFDSMKEGDCLIISLGYGYAQYLSKLGKTFQDFRSDLLAIIGRARSLGAEPFIVISQPSCNVEENHLRTSDAVTRYRALSIKAAQEAGVPYYDLYADMMSVDVGASCYVHGKEKYTFDLNEAGAQRVADMVREAVYSSEDITSLPYGGKTGTGRLCENEYNVLESLGLADDTDGWSLNMSNAKMTERFARAVGENVSAFASYSNDMTATVGGFLGLCFDYLGIYPETADLVGYAKDCGIMKSKTFAGAAQDLLTYDNFAGVMYNLIMTKRQQDGKSSLQRMLESGTVTDSMMDATGDAFLKGYKYIVPHTYKPRTVYDSKSKRNYNIIDFEGSDMIRPYFTAQQWNSTEDKFIVGAKPGLMFEYDTKTEKMRFLDFAITSTNRLEAFVNLQNLVFYEKPDGRGKITYWKYNLNTDEKSFIARLPDGISAGCNVNPTNDGKYMSVQWVAADDSRDWYNGKNRSRVLARLNIETGEFYTQRSYEFNESNCELGHPQLNPANENIMMFCHEGSISSIKDRIWVCNLKTGEMTKVHQHAVNSSGAITETITHENWSGNGEYIFFVRTTNSNTTDGAALGRIRPDGSGIEYFANPGGYSFWHCSTNYDGGFVAGDTNTNPASIVLTNTKTNTQKCLVTYSPGSYWPNDPYQPHVTLGTNAKKVCWEMPTPSGGGKIYGFAWMDISDLTK